MQFVNVTFLVCNVPAIPSQIHRVPRLPGATTDGFDEREELRKHSSNFNDGVSTENGRYDKVALHPLAALDLAGNVLHIIHFTASLVSQVEEIRSTGNLEYTSSLQALVGDLKRQVLRVKATVETQHAVGSDEVKKGERSISA